MADRYPSDRNNWLVQLVIWTNSNEFVVDQIFFVSCSYRWGTISGLKKERRRKRKSVWDSNTLFDFLEAFRSVSMLRNKRYACVRATDIVSAVIVSVEKSKLSWGNRARISLFRTHGLNMAAAVTCLNAKNTLTRATESFSVQE